MIQVGPNGTVVGIDVLEPLVRWSIDNVKKNHSYLLDSAVLTLKRKPHFRDALRMA